MSQQPSQHTSQQTPCECRSIFYTVCIDAPREAWKRLVNRWRGVADIQPQDAHVRIRQGAFVLDVREQHEYDAGHIHGSVLIPLGALESRMGELDAVRRQEVLVFCHGGKRSAIACAQLNASGFRNTLNITGGILAWKRSGLPLEQ